MASALCHILEYSAIQNPHLETASFFMDAHVDSVDATPKLLTTPKLLIPLAAV
jgi:hypothetical protein